MLNVIKGVLFVLVLLQFIPVKIENKPFDKALEIKAPEEIMAILKRSCYDCHSNEVKIPWYASIAPFSYTIANHIDLGRKWVNFSEWENYTQEQKDKKLDGIFRTVYAAMPLPSYLWLHPEAKLTKDEIKKIRDWTGKAPF
ncbi:MAG: heme-binding domain-containing protein [Campylobacterales bacterium]|nr:heme-binding domain-containing protein [Campylobacterales bacterium]